MNLDTTVATLASLLLNATYEGIGNDPETAGVAMVEELADHLEETDLGMALRKALDTYNSSSPV